MKRIKEKFDIIEILFLILNFVLLIYMILESR